MFSLLHTFNISLLLDIILKISIPLFAITFSFHNLSLKKIFQACSIMFIISTTLNGIFISSGNFLNGIMISSPIPLILSLLLFVGISLIFKRSIELISKKKALTDNIIVIELEYGNKKIKKTALMDTGNNLQFNNSPVNIINFKLFNELTDINLSDYLSKNFCLKNSSYINCSTITGNKKMLMLTLDKMTIYKNSKAELIEKPNFALSLNFNNENYDLILNNLLV